MKLPQDFILKYQEILGNESSDFFASFNGQKVSAFRVQPTKNHSNFNSYKALSDIPNAYYGKISGKDIRSLAGVIYSQDPSAMYVAKVLAPQPGDLVLDLCAAPGGKTTYLASQLNNEGFLLSNDIDLKRSKILAENVGRMGNWNVAVSNETPDNLAKRYPATFSKILVDAPCSGEGMFRKDPKAMKYWSSDYPANCAKLQKQILNSAFQMLKPGGILVYSTCTFSPEENEGVVSGVLNDHVDLNLLPISIPEGGVSGNPKFGDGNIALANCLRLYPHRFTGEGQFIAKFQKNGEKQMNRCLKSPKKTKTSLPFTEFVSATFNKRIPEIITINDVYYSLNPTFYNLVKNLHLIKKGVKIGTVKKNRFIPDQEIFQALPVSEIKTTFELSPEQFLAYCHGEELKIKEKTSIKKWVGLTYQGYLFGFGHWVQDRIKNFYPKNLRH